MRCSPPSERDPLEELELDSEPVFEGALLKVRRDRVRLPDGAESMREYVRHPGAVVVLAVLPDGRLLFERQYRYPLRRAFLELPAGKIDAGEDLLSCACRELREETGYEADEWQYLGVMHPCIGYSDERIEIFLARGLSHVGDALDDGEFLEVLTLSVEEALEAAQDGRITDGKSIVALFRGFRALGLAVGPAGGS
ncbi:MULTISPECIES: NUDIX domain-containing protein [Aromatoleum]|uniref:GDP-mannose pyrophosphatase n=2 Tax=Aromatoleum TaxID=551759 RepID=A0ABX1NV59_9RHOO|nr:MULTISPECIES: NUDIX hydrolase [Aromatoleum]MCK0508876.1 NUDIX hydrolase [Aromatoleum anaerobium]NMG15671.1 NUDIX domain-containing protein [Aromatoleum bremense]QTQ30653.1 Hydrolase, NUDIX family [Aromatoleum bremense]